jgi:predicted ATPase/DNA-binding CsgD family transcriptional regulator
LAEIGGLLATPACRLLTLVGLGGIGKTRLAIRAAAQAREGGAFADGAHFVALQPVAAADLIAPAIADALRLPLSGARDPTEQLLHFLAQRAALLVLDTFEHLPEGAGLLAQILAAAPGVKLLVTSREALMLQEEWRYPVQGLPYPEDDGPDAEDHAAVQLFAERARRVRRDFSLAAERGAVARICRLVEGMPLALELAAAWAGALPCAEIAADLARGLEVLATRLRDLPERHRSMRAVFDHSWSRLDDTERQVFRRLSVFRGGFRREAAETVAGAAVGALSALVDKSLVRLDADGRYHLHELLRQYAEERLWERPEEAARAEAAHAACYAEFLEARLPRLLGADQRVAKAEIRGDLDNVRAAWRWVVREGDAAALCRAAPTLAALHHRSGTYQEGVAAFQEAARGLAEAAEDGETGLALVTVLTQLGRLYVRLGQIEESQEVLVRADALHARLGRPMVPGMMTDPRLGLAQIEVIRGAYEAAVPLTEAALAAAEAHDHRHNQKGAWELLARTAMHLGRTEEAQRYAERAHALAEASGDRWELASVLTMLGNLADIRHDYAGARTHFEASLAIQEELGDRGGMGTAQNKLGLVALRLGDPAAAQRHFAHSRAVFEEVGEPGGLLAALEGLGNAAAAQGDYATARERFREALSKVRGAAAGRAYGIYLASLLASVGELAIRAGAPDRGRGLLALSLHHPTVTPYMQERAQRLLGRQLTGDPPTPLRSTQELVALVLDALADLDVEAPPPSGAPAAVAPAQGLIEPLSARELEVLRLLAEGRTNGEIAQTLVITVGTVKTHVHNVCGKLGAPTRGRAAALARELGLLAPPER